MDEVFDFSLSARLVLGIWGFGIGLRFLLSLTEAKFLGTNFSIPPHPGNYIIDFGPLAILGAYVALESLHEILRS